MEVHTFGRLRAARTETITSVTDIFGYASEIYVNDVTSMNASYFNNL